MRLLALGRDAKLNGRVGPFRQDFPALSRTLDGMALHYLDNAATTLKPDSVIQAIAEHYASNGANIHRGKHRLSEEASDAYEAARVVVATYLNATAGEIVFVKNTTEALNLVAHGLGLEEEDVVVGCLDSHHSQILPWRRAATLHLCRTDREGRADLDHFVELLQMRPKVVALTHCSNVTGTVHPIADMVREVRRAGDALIVLDAAQSIPHERLDVARLDVDFVAFSAHKMLGPSGVGCLFGRSRHLERLKPPVLGGGTVDWVDADGHRERRVPYRLEAGTPPIADVIGFGAAIRYLEALDPSARAEHERALTDALIGGAIARPYLKLIGSTRAEARHPIATLRFENKASAGEVALMLSDSYGFMCRSGYLCAQPLVTALADVEVLRISAYLYNEVAEIGGLYEALDEIVHRLGIAA
ncbi:MAG TPA: aminotransferase class V-fold PLP-dependent enzyme [Beijerinckiaceae bacterium]|jgi:cysteine desulfurase/selenocysteine lyase